MDSELYGDVFIVGNLSFSQRDNRVYIGIGGMKLGFWILSLVRSFFSFFFIPFLYFMTCRIHWSMDLPTCLILL